MDIKDAVRLFTEQTDLLANEKEVIYCFGMSKMTLITET